MGGSSFEHQTVLLREAVDALNIEGKRKSGVYIDGTFGRGGHSRKILERLNDKGRLIAFDKDSDAVEAAGEIKDSRFEIVHGSFAQLDDALHFRKIESVAGILFDLGISSPQVDDAKRGFSFLRDGPLDMRMDVSRGVSAAEWLAEESLENIAEVIRKYGEERFAFQIAKAIVARREVQPISRTRELAEVVASVVKGGKNGKNPATRTFQAIRIFINRELEELEIGLSKAFDYLASQGRLVVISFHSLEDRIVKEFISSHSNVAPPDRRLPLRLEELPKPLAKKIGRFKPSLDEKNENPRSRSAVLRVCERLGTEDFA